MSRWDSGFGPDDPGSGAEGADGRRKGGSIREVSPLMDDSPMGSMEADDLEDISRAGRPSTGREIEEHDVPLPSLPDLLKEMVQMGGSDLHITVGVPPIARIDGSLQPLPYEKVTPDDSKSMLYSVMTDEQKAILEENLEVDFAFGIQGLARFRSNVFMQRGSIVGALRLIPWEILPFDELGLPRVVNEVCALPRGLVLVTGPTGSGKSTTLASMIDKINSTQNKHILTIEDPIEYMHSHKRSIVNQRELHADTRSFTSALRAALREDPDVVLIGEMRDLESTELALKLAETGHLTFATLHTNSAVQTINRVIDIFPQGQQQQIRTQLSFTLQAVLSQSLLPRKSGKGRALAVELMMPNGAIRNLIREEKVEQITSVMQSGQGVHGMQTFNQSLAALVAEGKITQETAMGASSDPRELSGMLERLEGEGSADRRRRAKK